MSASRTPLLLRRLSARVIRGPHARFVLTDLEDAFERDLARGLSFARACGRYVTNALASAASLQRARLRPPFSWLDVKVGLRMLVKQPGITLVAVFALGVGIPVGMAPWQFVNAIEAPLPVDEGSRIRLLRHWDLSASRPEPEATTLRDYLHWREEVTELETIGATRLALYDVDSEGESREPVAGARVTASIFELLRVPPALGRSLGPADETIGGSPVVVMGHDLWQSRFAGAADIVGREIRIGGEPHTVVGVMPEGFLFPIRQQLWLPLRERLGTSPSEALPLIVLGRLADGESVEQVQARLDAIDARRDAEDPGAHASLRPEVVPSAFLFFGFPRGGLRSQLEFPMAQLLALVLLGVACVNVGMLVFARTAGRSAELAVRTALGASRARIVTQVLTESFVLAVVAAGFGLVIVDLLPVRLLRFAGVADLLPYWVDTGVTPGAALRALSLAVFSAVVAGVVPALRLTGRAVESNIRRARAGGGDTRFGRVSGALIVADVAIAVMVVGLAVGLGDFLLKVTDGREGVGIDAEEYLAVELRLPTPLQIGDGASAAIESFRARVGETQQELVRRLRQEPAVRAVALGSALPRMDHRSRQIEVEGEPTAEGTRPQHVRVAHVDVEFFAQLDQPILSGRGFDTADLEEGVSSVVVNTTFVEQVLEGRNPIGRRVRERRIGATDWGRWHVIVGVVDHLGMHALQPKLDAGFYLPAAPGSLHPVRIAIHLGDDPTSFVPRLREITRAVDPTAVIASPRALNEIHEGDYYVVLGATAGGGLLVGILLALAASGLYAITSFTVSQRTREIGVRAALGARRHRIALTVARRALVQIGVGVLIGLPLAGRVFYEVTESRGGATLVSAASTIGLGVGVMALVGLAACAAPTLRALRIMPTEALRE